MIKKISAAFLLLWSTSAYAQNSADSSFNFNKRYSIKELQYDLAVLKDSLQIRHPALYRHTSKAAFDAAFAMAEKKIDKPLTQAEFYGIAAPIVSKVGDIHTTIEPSDELFAHLAAKCDLLPFDVRIINKEVFIASNNSADSSIQAGVKILKVNGRTIKEMLLKMGSYFSDEGTNETLKQKRVEQRFAFQYYLAYGYSKTFTVEYTTGRGAPQIKKIDARPFSEIREKRKENQLRYPKLKSLFAQPPYLSLSVDDGKKTAILTIKWFQNDVLQGNNEDFKSFIDSAFTEVRSKKIANLVIDIRNNGGGESENAAYLYSYLTSKPFRFLYSLEVNQTTYEADKERGLKYEPVKNTGKYRTADSTTAFPQFFGLNMQQPKANSFTGKVYVLIDGLTTSAAPQFAALVKQNRRGILIGEDAPGSLYGGSGRGYSYFLLPNSGLLAMISHYRLYLADPHAKYKDTVVTADHKPARSIRDILDGVDKDILYTMKLIERDN